ncbi:hypothetical protein N0V88_000991 [Collariella sp. IMI 366227]|nr:hypothetical protein N0V88_000991 [Collariella sp. IMI 366227]
MGFVAGFAGGVTLTLSLTYLALHTHSQNRQAQSAVLRSQASTLDLLVPDSSHRRRNTSVALPDGTYRARESLEQRAPAGPAASFIETAKTKWNSEILAAARWAQQTDWTAVREEAEEGVARLLGVELKKEVEWVPQPEARVSKQSLERERLEREKEKVEAEEIRREVDAKVKRARERAGVMAHAVAEEAREVADGRAHEMVERTRAAVHLAEERVESRMDARLLHVSDVNKALAERYDSARRQEGLKRSVEEVLRERYIPMDERDNSKLRGP